MCGRPLAFFCYIAICFENKKIFKKHKNATTVAKSIRHGRPTDAEPKKPAGNQKRSDAAEGRIRPICMQIPILILACTP